jgi:hypothetical protein
MKGLLRPLFVGGISIAIAATSLVGSSSVALAATRPAIVTWSVSTPVYEGDRPFATATFTDPDLTDLHTVDISWGDNSYDTYTLPVGDRSFSVQKTVPYKDETTTDLRVQITVNDPLFSNSRFVLIPILNAPPVITAFSLSATDLEVGGAVTATGRFTDGGVNDTHTLKLDWGDGSPLTTMNLAAGVFAFTTEAHTYAANGDYIVSAIVTDNSGAWAPATSTVSVHAANHAPSVVSFGVTAGTEGGTSTLALTFADADALDTHTVTVSWGDGATSLPVVLSADLTTFDASHVYDDTGSFPVVLTLEDSAHHVVTVGASVSPTNVAPAMGSLSLSPSAVVDHQTLTVSGSFTDPGKSDTFTLTLSWGDGTSWTDSPVGTRSFSQTHAYAAAGPVTITATVVDRDNGRSTSSVDLVVGSSNHAPSSLSLSVSSTGTNVVVNASFNDPDAGDTHTVLMTWGDGASVRPLVAAGTTTFTASHVYAASGTYPITATVTDAAGAWTDATAPVVVTVPAASAADVLDEMSALVLTFDLDRNTERWLLKKIDDLKASLAYGNGQVCQANGAFEHILAFARRTIGEERYAALTALTAKLDAAAGCASNGAQSPKVQKAAALTTKRVSPTTTATSSTPSTPKKETTVKSAKAETKATEGRNDR